MKTQMAYFKTHFPDWDVRGVLIPQAKTWVEEGNEKFLEFVDDLDLFIGLTRSAPLSDRVPAGVRRIAVDAFLYRGWQPDAIWVPGLPSVLKLGVIQSRIVCDSWRRGDSQAETVARFTPETYRALGYFEARQHYRAEVDARFEANCGFGILDFFDQWEDRFAGNFCYLPNHPRNEVFYDILHRAMQTAGLADDITPAAVISARNTIEDYLEEGMHWPLYPSIAAHHGVTVFPHHWRLSALRHEGVSFDTAELVARSWTIFDAHPAARDLIGTALGAAGQGVADQGAAVTRPAMPAARPARL